MCRLVFQMLPWAERIRMRRHGGSTEGHNFNLKAEPCGEQRNQDISSILFNISLQIFIFYQPSKLFHQLKRSFRQRQANSSIDFLIFYLRHLTGMQVPLLLYLFMIPTANKRRACAIIVAPFAIFELYFGSPSIMLNSAGGSNLLWYPHFFHLYVAMLLILLY